MRQYLFLVNPISGTKDKGSLINLIRNYSSGNAISYSIEYTNPEGQYAYLRQLIENKGITDVVICGGDGTINQVTGALVDTDVNFGIIPYGSGNGLAHSAEIPVNVTEALDLIVHTGTIQETDAFLINGKFACMLSGIGFDADVAHAFAQQKTRGLLTYTLETIKTLFTARTYSFTIEVDGVEHPTEAFFVSIANSNQFGNQFTIAPKASLNDGLLDVVIAKKMNKIFLPFTVFSQVTGMNEMKSADKIEDGGHIHYFQTDRLVLHNPDKARLHIDGDPAETAERFEIQVVKNAFRLWVPKKQESNRP